MSMSRSRSSQSINQDNENKENGGNRLQETPRRINRSHPPAHIRTVIRLRADVESNGVEIEKGANADGLTLKYSDGNTASFNFDRVLDSSATQQETFESVVGDSVKTCLKGENFCILAYGQTGSGKTHSMLGSTEDPGIISRFVDTIFERIHAHQASDNVVLTASFYELYMEKMYDLIGSVRTPLTMHFSGKPRGLSVVTVKSSAEVRQLQQCALERRATAATMFNNMSSRSHAIFEFGVHHEMKQPDGRKIVLLGRCFFVDLAGCERTNNLNSSHKNESILINKSLLALQCVVENRSAKANYVNYRDSVLTRILQPCFDGNANITVLGAINPQHSTVHQSVNTLRFVSKAKLIVLCPKINQNPENTLEECPQYDTNFWKSVETAHTRFLIMNRPVGVCIVELHSDMSLNQWHSLQDDFTLEIFPEKPLILINQVDDDWYATAVEDGVDINNEALLKDSKIQLKHGDCIVLSGKRFFIVSLDATCDHSKFKYDKIKVEYLEATAERNYKMIADRARAEAQLQFAAVYKQFAEEKAALQTQVEEQEKTKKNHNRAQKECANKLKTVLEDYVAFEKEFVNMGADANKLPKPDGKPEKSLQTAQMMMDAEMVNNACYIGGLDFLSFTVNVKLDGGINGVRVTNRQTKMHANMDVEKFLEFNDMFFNIYNTTTNYKNISSEVKSLLGELDLHWEQKGVASSYMVEDMVKTCVKKTADRRSSSVADVARGMQGRQSVIATMMQHEMIPEKDYQQIYRFAFQYMDVSVDNDHKQGSTLDQFLLKLHKCYMRLENFGMPDLTTNQKSASCLVNSVRLQTDIMLLGASLEHLSSNGEFNSCTAEMDTIFDGVEAFYSSFNTFLRQVINQNDNFDDLFTSVQHSCHQVILSVGTYLCYYSLPCPSQYSAFAPHIYQGYFMSLKCLIDEVQTTLETSSSLTMKGMLRKKASQIVLTVFPLIGNNKNFNFPFYKNVFIPCFQTFEKTLLSKWRSENPAIFYESMITLIKSEYSAIPKIQEVVGLLRDTITYCNAHLNEKPLPLIPLKFAASH